MLNEIKIITMGNIVDTVQILFTLFIIHVLTLGRCNLQRIRFEKQFARWAEKKELLTSLMKNYSVVENNCESFKDGITYFPQSN